MELQYLIAIAVSLGAGAAAWIGARRITEHIDDPLFTERLHAHRIKMTYVHVFVIVIAATAAQEYALLAIVFALFAIAAGGFPARKALYGETWSLGQYLASRTLLIVTAGAPWIAIMLAPQAVLKLGAEWAPAIALVIMALLFFQQPLLLVGLRAEPLRDEALMQLLNPILEKTQAPRPRIYEGGSATGQFTNAFALPDGNRSRVVLTRALLRELEPVETAAIFAHEAAHLEEWAKKKVRIRVWVGRFVVPFLAVAPEVYFLSDAPQAANWMATLWPFIFAVLMMITLVRRQSHESAADLRALELGADPEALIRAMEKMHKKLGMPRRVDAPREEHMTHPSLARRLQAIRKKAGLDVAPPPELPRAIETRDAKVSLQFTADGIETNGGGYRYDALQSLLVQQTRSGWELMGRSGKDKIRVPVTANGAAEVQAILDSIDIRFTPTVAAPKITQSARLAAVLVFLFALFPGISFPPIIASLLGIITGSAPALAASGATAIAAGLYSLRTPPMPFVADLIRPIGVATILVGVLCLFLVARIPAADRARHLRVTVIVLGILTALALSPAISLLFGQPLTRLFLVARDRPSATILFAGLAAAVAVAGRWRTALVPALAAATLFACGTQTIGSRFLRDPLITTREPKWVSAPAPLATRKLEENAYELRLSPSGRAFAVRVGIPEQEQQHFEIAGSLQGPTTRVAAHDLAFVDDTRLVRYDVGTAQSMIESIDVNGQATGWRVAAPSAWSPRLRTEGDRWVVIGMGVPSYKQIRVSGIIGQPGYSADRENPIVTASITSRPMHWSLMFLTQGALGSEYWRARGDKKERVAASILSPGSTVSLPGSRDWAVAGFDSRATYIGVLAETSPAVKPAGMIDGYISGIEPGLGSRIAMNTPTHAVIWNLASGRAIRIGGNNCIVLDVALGDHVAGVLLQRDQTTRLEIYPTDAL